jgi:hypothetical protein
MPGWRWKVEALTRGWVQTWPVPCRRQNLHRRLRGRDPDAYLGGYTLVRRRDGLVVELGSSPLLYRPEVFEGVLNDIGETAGADEIHFEIVARSNEASLLEELDEPQWWL